MPRFFTEQIAGDLAVITGEDARHIALSLRMKAGEPVTVCSGNGTDYPGTLSLVTPQQVEVQLEEGIPCRSEPATKITLYQALPKGDKMEWIIQKAVELGVTAVVPVLTSRCVSRPDAKSFEKKLLRYQKISEEAAKQCGRGMIPKIEPLIGFGEALKRIAAAQRGILFYEQGTAPLRQLLAPDVREIAVLIGSEGGFSPEEAAQAMELGIPAATLGPRILRCETAPLAALAMILYEQGDMDSPGKQGVVL